MQNNLLTQEAVILTPTSAYDDDYGDAEQVYMDLAGRTFLCRVERSTNEEMEIDRDTRRSFSRLYLSQHAIGLIDALSRVMVDGVIYEVFGSPNVIYKRRSPSHIEAVLRVIEG